MSQIDPILDQKTCESADQLLRLVCTSDEARTEARTLLEATRDKRGEARERHGLLAWSLGQSKAAAEALEGAESPCPSYVLGLSLADLGRHDEAATALRRAARSEKNVGARYALLAARVRLGEAAEVLKDAQSLLKAGDTADAHFVVGLAQEALGDYDKAMESWTKAIERDAQHAASLFRLAYQADLRGLDDEALALYERCANLNPAHASAYVNLGILHEDRGDYDKAADCFRVVLDADPTNPRAKLFLKDAEASKSMFYDDEMEKAADERRQVLAMPINEFELSVRARNCLKKMAIETLGDLVRLTEEELLGIRNFGDTSLREVKKLLNDKGLRLGMAPEALLQYQPPVASPEALEKPIEEMNLSARAKGCMDQLGIKTIGQLTAKTKTELMNARNFGRTSLKEVLDKLTEMGLALADG